MPGEALTVWRVLGRGDVEPFKAPTYEAAAARMRSLGWRPAWDDGKRCPVWRSPEAVSAGSEETAGGFSASP